MSTRRVSRRRLVELSSDLLPLRVQLNGSFDEADPKMRKLKVVVRVGIMADSGSLGEIVDLNIQAELIEKGRCRFGKVSFRVWAIECVLPDSKGVEGTVTINLGADLRGAWRELFEAIEERVFKMVARLYRRYGILLRRDDVRFTFRCPGDRYYDDDAHEDPDDY